MVEKQRCGCASKKKRDVAEQLRYKCEGFDYSAKGCNVCNSGGRGVNRRKLKRAVDIVGVTMN